MGFAYSCSRRSVQSNGTTTRTSIEISSCFALLPLQLFVRDDKLNNNDTRMPTSLVAPSFKSTDETRFIQHNEIDRKTFQPHKTRHFSCLAAKFYIWLVKYFSWKFFSWKIHDYWACFVRKTASWLFKGVFLLLKCFKVSSLLRSP